MLTLKGGAPFQLAKAVSQRAQQVTSRQLSAEDSPEITLYAFDGGEGVSEAHYAGETLYFGLTGAPVIRLGASEDVLDPGDAFVVPRDAKHSLGSDARRPVCGRGHRLRHEPGGPPPRRGPL